jgi:hypothetical protein
MKTSSGGGAFVQFVCQRVFPALGLLAHEIECQQNCYVRLPLLFSRVVLAVGPVLMADDPKNIGSAIVAISRARRTLA